MCVPNVCTLLSLLVTRGVHRQLCGCLVSKCMHLRGMRTSVHIYGGFQICVLGLLDYWNIKREIINSVHAIAFIHYGSYPTGYTLSTVYFLMSSKNVPLCTVQWNDKEIKGQHNILPTTISFLSLSNVGRRFPLKIAMCFIASWKAHT